MADNVEVKFLGNLEGIRVSVTQMSEILRGLVSPIQGVRAQLGELAEAFAAAFAVEKINEFARSMGELGEQVERSAAIMGVSTDTVQELGFIAASSGVGVQELQMSFARLSRSIIEQSDVTKRALAALGLGFSDLAGKGAEDALRTLAPRFAEIENGATKDAIAMALLGRAGSQLVPFLNQGAEGIDRLIEKATELGAIIPAASIARLAEMHQQFVQLDAAVKGATVAGFMPFTGAVEGVVAIVTDLATEFTAAMTSGGMMKDIVTALAAALKGVVTVIASFIFVLKDLWATGVFAVDTIGAGFMTLGKAVAAVISAMSGQWTSFFNGLIEVATGAIERIKAQFSGLANIVSAAAHGDLAGVRSAYGEMEAASAAAGKKMADGLSQATKGIDLSKARGEFDTFAREQAERNSALGRQLLANDATFAKEYNRIWDDAHKHEEESRKRSANMASPDRNARDRVAAALKVIDDEVKAEQDGLKRKTSVWDAAVSRNEMTYNERYRLVQDATEREFQAELAAYQRGLLIPKLTLAQEQELLNKISALRRSHTQKMIDLDNESIKAAQANIEGYLSTVTGAFNSQLRGLLAGTTSWKNAMKAIAGDLIMAMIQGIEKWVVTFIAGQLATTTAATTGAAERAAAETASTGAGMLSVITNALKAIGSGVASTIAGVSGFDAPLLGPAAPAAGIAAGAVVEGAAMGALAPFEVGAWRIGGVSPALLHPNEMVLPGPSADVVRDAITGGGGGGGGDTHMHFPGVMDARGFLQAISNHSSPIAKIISKAMTRNPGSRPKF